MAESIAFVLLMAVLLTAAVTDAKADKVYNWLTYPAAALGLTYWAAAGFLWPESFGEDYSRAAAAGAGLIGAFWGLLAGFVPFLIVRSLGGLGMGDVKLMGAVGALSASWQVVLGTAFYGLVIAALMAVVFMVRARIVKRTLKRIFGAALLSGARVKADLEPLPGTPTVPYAVAAAAGGLVAGLEHLLQVALPWSWLTV